MMTSNGKRRLQEEESQTESKCTKRVSEISAQLANTDEHIETESQGTNKSEKLQDKSIKLEDFPPEILLKILSFLEINGLLKCCQTSKKIRSICYDDSLWQTINLSEKKVPTEFLRKVIGYGCKSLNLSKANLVGTLRLENKSQLTNLNLLGCSATSQVFEELLKSCHYLQKLQFTYNINVDYQKMIQLKLMPNLNSLFIDYPKFTALDVEIEQQLIKKLRDVSVNGNPPIATLSKEKAFLMLKNTKDFKKYILKSYSKRSTFNVHYL